MSSPIHVAVAVISDEQGRILIAKRKEGQHLAGYWEFPGGKLEQGEAAENALVREIREEVNLDVGNLNPLIQIPWNYSEKTVCLEVFSCELKKGSAVGLEGQELLWVQKQELSQYKFPAANRGIVNALQLPSQVLVTGEAKDDEEFFAKLDIAVAKGIQLVQVRIPTCTQTSLASIVQGLQQQASLSKLELFLNCPPDWAKALGFDQIHLKSKYLNLDAITELRSEFKRISASVHSEEELALANKLQLDFILLSPVRQTVSHPDNIPLGWEKFERLVKMATMPVYALGGMTPDDLNIAKKHGAQGIAAISGFWN